MISKHRELLQRVLDLDLHESWCATVGENRTGRDCDCRMAEMRHEILAVLADEGEHSA